MSTKSVALAAGTDFAVASVASAVACLASVVWQPGLPLRHRLETAFAQLRPTTIFCSWKVYFRSICTPVLYLSFGSHFLCKVRRRLNRRPTSRLSGTRSSRLTAGLVVGIVGNVGIGLTVCAVAISALGLLVGPVARSVVRLVVGFVVVLVVRLVLGLIRRPAVLLVVGLYSMLHNRPSSGPGSRPVTVLGTQPKRTRDNV